MYGETGDAHSFANYLIGVLNRINEESRVSMNLKVISYNENSLKEQHRLLKNNSESEFFTSSNIGICLNVQCLKLLQF